MKTEKGVHDEAGGKGSRRREKIRRDCWREEGREKSARGTGVVCL